jgi:hypothetical protein
MSSPMVVTTSGEIILPGSGGGVVIIDAWSHQTICMITDMGNEQRIAIHVTMSPTAMTAMAESNLEIHETRTPDFPVRFEEIFSEDKHGNTRSKFRPKS